MSIHEDNSGSFIPEENLPPQFTTQSNHYDSKNVLFCEEIHNCRVRLKKFSMMGQLGNIFTKVLPRAGF